MVITESITKKWKWASIRPPDSRTRSAEDSIAPVVAMQALDRRLIDGDAARAAASPTGVA